MKIARLTMLERKELFSCLLILLQFTESWWVNIQGIDKVPGIVYHNFGPPYEGKFKAVYFILIGVWLLHIICTGFKSCE